MIESVVRGDRRNSRARFILASALQATGQTEAATAHREEIERYQRIQDRLKSLRTEFRMRSTPEMRFEYATLLLEIETDAGIGALLGFVAEHPDHIGAHQLLRDQYKANGDGERYEYHQRELRRLGADETPTETTNQPVEQISE